MSWTYTNEDEVAHANLERLMKIDSDTIDVIKAMRNQGRTWGRISLCFRKQIMELK